MRLYNSLSRTVEDFVPINPPHVGMYTCGPTVYDYATIGNFRTYTTADLLLRTLKWNNFAVEYVMNITDVGHLTGDNQGDADTGEDRMERSAAAQRKSAWDIAKFYTDAFLEDYDRLHLTRPKELVKATDHIQEQILFIQVLQEKGFTYRTRDGIYFDTAKFPEYGQLSSLDQIKEGARVEINPEKRNPRDFALWKFTPAGVRRQMEWDSPWGKGFPGWHIECSAMSMKYLGETFDIHTGGIDLRETHHPNEIAQSEAATGKKFVHYWVHGAFILVDGKRMGKSLGNSHTISDLVKKGFDPLALRYLYMTTHYRQEMNFTFAALEGAQNALTKLREHMGLWGKPAPEAAFALVREFQDAINDDLQMPQALSVVWKVVKSSFSDSEKAATLLAIDDVLGLGLADYQNSRQTLSDDEIPGEVQQLLQERNMLRKQKRFHLADEVRHKIEKMGYEVVDDGNKTTLVKM